MLNCLTFCFLPQNLTFVDRQNTFFGRKLSIIIFDEFLYVCLTGVDSLGLLPEPDSMVTQMNNISLSFCNGPPKALTSILLKICTVLKSQAMKLTNFANKSGQISTLNSAIMHPDSYKSVWSSF